MKFLLILCASLVSMTVLSAEYWRPVTKKIIECGWATRLPMARLCKNIVEIENSSPCSGMALRLCGKDEQGNVYFSNQTISLPLQNKPCGPVEFKKEYFRDDIETLKKTRFKKFTDNFISTTRNSGKVDLFSDNEWKIVCSNYKILAEIARETGLKGLIVDFEWYKKSLPIFEQLPEGKSYQEVAELLRKRGREWGTAVFEAYPDIKLLFYFLVAYQEDLRDTPENAGLVIHFVNGIYDVLPPRAVLIEGHEHHGYGAADDADFARLRYDFEMLFPRLIDRNNYGKFCRQTQFSCAYFLDAYIVDAEKKRGFAKKLAPHIEKHGKLNLMRRNLSRAMELSDEYVWIWSEAGRWYNCKAGHPGSKLVWEKHLPGVTDAFNSVLAPIAFAKSKLNTGNYINLVKNPEFTCGTDKYNMPHDFYFWQNIKSGSCTILKKAGYNQKDAVAVSGCRATFTLSQKIKVKADWLCFVRVRAKILEGKSGRYAVLCAYKNSKKEELPKRTTSSCRFGQPDNEGWMIAEMAVLVPEHASELHLRLMGGYQQNNDTIVFDKVEMYRIL